MKRLLTCLFGLCVIASAAFAGVDYSGKEMKQVAAPPPCLQWYADNEFNVGIWGTYVFTGNEWRDDRYIEADHAWGGGVDLKYFFHRYFGIGIEGWAVDARREFEDISGVEVFRLSTTGHESRAIGSVLGTFTLRYPIHCSRFAPYLWAGAGAIFGGGQREKFHVNEGPLPSATTDHLGATTEAIGQFGGGVEVRFTPHVGWINDFSWNVVDGRDNNFGMVRSGINFAF
jgi:hypothetical protein